ncbi:MAG: polysaccharide deacetylase family protein, partial [Agathobacter sp.]|nr:polysaccharide deacetylase family protein [Agathobacter sp.]
GKAYTGKKKVKDSYYYFASNGKMETGWKTIEKKQFYFSQKSGKMVTGKQNISHYLCKFNEKGVLERKIDKNKKMVALTYDDGPSIYTPKLLDTLEKYDAVATFFVVGSRVSQYSGTIKREFNLGCEIGNHTYDHKTITRISSSELKKQISKTNAAVKKVTGGNPVVMRPPGGGINSTSKSNLGMPAIIWSVDTLDWKTRSSSQTTSAVLNHVHDGDIILMHDLHSAACDAAATIVPTLIDRGYQLVTVSELAECRGGMKKNQSYFKFTK